MAGDRIRVLFVCTGNICRSTMAEEVGRFWAAQAGAPMDFDSVGVSDEERGNSIDRRAASVLADHGYPTGNHRARQVTAADIEAADFVIAAEVHHVRRLKRLAPQASHIHLISVFDPDSTQGSGLPDPWYGGMSDFQETLTAIEAAMPNIIGLARLAP